MYNAQQTDMIAALMKALQSSGSSNSGLGNIGTYSAAANAAGSGGGNQQAMGGVSRTPRGQSNNPYYNPYMAKPDMGAGIRSDIQKVTDSWGPITLNDLPIDDILSAIMKMI